MELSVGELAARSGVAVSALHFFERQGLITSRRTAGNSAATAATRCAGWRSSGSPSVFSGVAAFQV